MSHMGQSRRFGDVCDMSALPPTTAVMMQCREWQKGARGGPRANEQSIRSRACCLASGEQIAAAEVVDREHDALKVIPPDPRADVVHGLLHRAFDQPKHLEKIILVQRLTVPRH